MRAHGVVARYDHGPDENDTPGKGCRCQLCRTAKTKREKARRLAKQSGTYKPMVDAEPVRQHVRTLHDKHGLGYPAIAKAAGVRDGMLDDLLYGLPSQGKPPVRKMRSANAEALLRLTPADVHTDSVSALGTQRRLQGMAAIGWPLSVIAPRVDVHRDHLNMVILSPTTARVSRNVADKVTAVCRTLLTQTPESAGVPQNVATRIRRRAQSRGWPSILAWDDIDNPDETPNLGEDSNRAEALLEDSEELLRWGKTLDEAAACLGVTAKYLGKARGRARQQVAS